MHRLFNNATNCTTINATCEEIHPIIPNWQIYLGCAAFVFSLCLGCCIYECYDRIVKARNAQSRFRSLGLLEPLNSVEIPGILEDTPSASSLIN